jgi:single-strand DNA-binding protein
MAGETTITVVGNLTADPELRYTQNGVAVANFTIASTPRTYDRQSGEWKDGEALFLRASVWREFAEHVANSLTKGSRVVATGRLRQRSYETKEGEKRTSAAGGQTQDPWATPGVAAAAPSDDIPF